MKLGYTILYVENVEANLDFYEKAFGLKRRFLHESGMYGEMETGETTLSFANRAAMKPEGFEMPSLSSTKNAHPFEVAFVTKDVSGAFEKAVNSGCKVVSKPKEKPWGQMVSYVQDQNGFLVEICSPISV